MKLDASHANMTIIVDSRLPRSFILKAYIHGQAADVVNKVGRSAIVHVGGKCSCFMPDFVWNKTLYFIYYM